MIGEGQKIGDSVLSPELRDSDRINKSSSASSASASSSKKSRTTSCERCKRRKQKCDHRLPRCTNCLKAGAQCVQPEKYVQHTPTSDDYTGVLEAKINQLEEKLRLMEQANASGIKIETGTSSSAMISQSPLSGNQSHIQSPGANLSDSGIGSSGTNTGGVAGNTSPNGPRMRGRGGTTVSILNDDPENDGIAPQSFTVVSSLLQETYWGQNKSDTTGITDDSGNNTTGNINNTSNTSVVNSPNTPVDEVKFTSNLDSEVRIPLIATSVGILPDYNFDEYLKYSPAKSPDQQAGDTLINSFLAGSQGRFPFVDRNLLQKYHNERFNAPPTLDCPKYRYYNFLLYASYAIASVSHSPTPGESPEFQPFGYYSTALHHAKMCKSNNILWHISTLLMCAMFQMRTDKDKGCHYDMVRKSMRICVEIGLHKGDCLNKLSKYDQEICKRLFWSVYSLERLFAVSTGRPFVIDEKEIDISFPCDMDDDELLDEKKIYQYEKYRDNNVLVAPTSMTFIIYIWRLRRLESDLVQAIYRVDRSIEERFTHVDYYLNALKEWKESNRVTTPKEQNITNTAYSRDIRLLLQPFLGRLSPDSDLFQMCVRETGHICQVFRDFYRKKESGFTTMAMHTNFVAGLTLVYCLWLAKDSSILPILENVRSCTAALYVLTERSKLCMNYRDTFENLVTTTMKHIIEHRRQKRLRREIQEIENQRVLKEQEREKQQRLERIHKEEEEQKKLRERLELERQKLRQQFIKQEPNDHSPNSVSSIPQGPLSTSTISSPSSTFPLIDRSPYLPTNPPSVRDLPPALHHAPSFPDTAASFAQLQTQPPPATFSTTANMELQKDWIEAYGYDDTLYNMIQDISSWTKRVDANNDISSTGVNAATTSDPTGWFNDNTADNAWMNISDFGYS